MSAPPFPLMQAKPLEYQGELQAVDPNALLTLKERKKMGLVADTGNVGKGEKRRLRRRGEGPQPPSYRAGEQMRFSSQVNESLCDSRVKPTNGHGEGPIRNNCQRDRSRSRDRSCNRRRYRSCDRSRDRSCDSWRDRSCCRDPYRDRSCDRRRRRCSSSTGRHRRTPHSPPLSEASSVHWRQGSAQPPSASEANAAYLATIGDQGALPPGWAKFFVPNLDLHVFVDFTHHRVYPATDEGVEGAGCYFTKALGDRMNALRTCHDLPMA